MRRGKKPANRGKRFAGSGRNDRSRGLIPFSVVVMVAAAAISALAEDFV